MENRESEKQKGMNAITLALPIPHSRFSIRDKMAHDNQKRAAGEAAIRYVEDGIVGVGTGSTVAYFIDALEKIRHRIDGAVSSSEQSTKLLQARGIRVFDLNAIGEIPVYVDGADECDPNRCLIKGCVTDNGNWILDVHGLRISDPVAMERDFNQITGVVTVGLFVQRRADVVL